MISMRHLFVSTSVAATAAMIANPVVARENCPDPPTQAQAIVSMQTHIFSALQNGDKAGWERLTDPDFVAFEGGHRYDRTSFFGLLKSAQASGRHFEWTVTSPNVEVSCTLATLAYVNKGSIMQGGSRSAVSWLETATFRYAAGQWRAAFIESMREAD
jgi:hypothetical protein